MDLKHGLGRKVYANADTYEGLWRDGRAEGPGRYKYAPACAFLVLLLLLLLCMHVCCSKLSLAWPGSSCHGASGAVNGMACMTGDLLPGCVSDVPKHCKGCTGFWLMPLGSHLCPAGSQ